MKTLKPLWVVLVTTAIAGVQFHHEYSGGEGSGSAVCLAPESSQAAAGDMLLMHLQSHR